MLSKSWKYYRKNKDKLQKYHRERMRRLRQEERDRIIKEKRLWKKNDTN